MTPKQPTTNDNSQMTPDQSAAALSYATHLSEKMFGFNSVPSEPENGKDEPEIPSQESRTAPKQGEKPEVDITSQFKDLEDKLTQKIDDLASKLDKDGAGKEIAKLRKELEEALKEDE